ncbi:unnamed protein product [Candidula unifasciata]|uniref:G-protein coupled receptors family 1 profile domain-containing protein n=1 Tax=Candidula unifasciata TaxID=100452 RepID=A0A8S3ZVQ4_9EUPU|nr:unnamed protein product [Candidula unifasciata]
MDKMATVLAALVVKSSSSGTLVVSAIAGLSTYLTTVPISMAGAELTQDTNNSYIDNTKRPSSHENKNKTINLTVSDEERQRYLEELQSETTMTMLPAIVFLLTIAVVGLVGNSLVIVVYSRRPQWTATGVLVATIAVLDLIANTIAIPAEIYDMFHTWTFHNSHLCRARLHATVFITLSSGMILVAVAVTRYRKVCHPFHWQVTTQNAKMISFVVCCLGFLLSLPYAVVSGSQTKDTPRRGIVGYQCALDDKYVNTFYPVAIYAVFLLLYVFCSLTLTVLYIFIGVTACRHSNMYGVSSPGTSTVTNATSCRNDSNPTEHCFDQNNCNSARCGHCYENNIDTVITGLSAIGGTRHLQSIEMNLFQSSDDQFQYNVGVLRDQTEVLNPLASDFYGTLEKTKNPLSVDSAYRQRDASHFPDNEENMQLVQGSGENVKTGRITIKNIKSSQDFGEDKDIDATRITKKNNPDNKMSSVESSGEDTDSDWKFTECCMDRLLDKRNRLDTARTNDELMNTIRPRQFLEKTGSKNDNVSNLYNKFMFPYVVANLSKVQIILFNLGMRTFFLNSAVNPVVYSLCDVNFRRECFKVIKFQQNNEM